MLMVQKIFTNQSTDQEDILTEYYQLKYNQVQHKRLQEKLFILKIEQKIKNQDIQNKELEILQLDEDINKIQNYFYEKINNNYLQQLKAGLDNLLQVLQMNRSIYVILQEIQNKLNQNQQNKQEILKSQNQIEAFLIDYVRILSYISCIAQLEQKQIYNIADLMKNIIAFNKTQYQNQLNQTENEEKLNALQKIKYIQNISVWFLILNQRLIKIGDISQENRELLNQFKQNLSQELLCTWQNEEKLILQLSQKLRENNHLLKPFMCPTQKSIILQQFQDQQENSTEIIKKQKKQTKNKNIKNSQNKQQKNTKQEQNSQKQTQQNSSSDQYQEQNEQDLNLQGEISLNQNKNQNINDDFELFDNISFKNTGIHNFQNISDPNIQKQFILSSLLANNNNQYINQTIFPHIDENNINNSNNFINKGSSSQNKNQFSNSLFWVDDKNANLQKQISEIIPYNNSNNNNNNNNQGEITQDDFNKFQSSLSNILAQNPQQMMPYSSQQLQQQQQQNMSLLLTNLQQQQQNQSNGSSFIQQNSNYFNNAPYLSDQQSNFHSINQQSFQLTSKLQNDNIQQKKQISFTKYGANKSQNSQIFKKKED
ncbi:hypothetical protein PPERSA_05938 [Pseudocohnilembus persalinus]|uniref:Uncharacterized protein n=1 Tax=Pseudocohnilembus persalinus TaxID=266149 RepID=A0A0V0R4W1_PSEPJ|nr:hypothetical protein PPERSA_05938 [Pseudocohnilembus persalinus]|eukprot:KRX09269.1 hypothetical protein PPERSA_05938 [Pseudocohnilembus persalinus]